MKTLLLTTLAVTVGGLSLAQSTAQRFEAPFAFHVGDKQLPAGDYIVQVQNHGTVILVSSKGHGGGGAFAFGYGVGNPNGPKTATAKLVFNKYEDGNYFLSQVWGGDWTNGMQTNRSRMEREVVSGKFKPTAQLKPVKVTILASLK